MFDAPADTWYLWLGVATASLLAFGVAVTLSTTPPPDAQRVADTVDSVAASQHEAIGEYPLDATAVRIGTHRIAIRDSGGTTHATVRYGPVTPVGSGTDLGAVLHGTPPERVFADADAFRTAAAAARNRTARWRPAEGNLVVRRVTWEDVDVTLVGV